MRFNFVTSIFKNFDWALFLANILLIFFGLAAIYSVALGRGTGEFQNFQKQLIWLFIAGLIMLILANIDYRFWQKFGWIGYLISILLLILVLTPLGSTIRGSRGWFNLQFFSFQPVELVKFFLILVLADILSRYGRTIHKLIHLFLIGLVVFLPFFLVMLQPDFGSGLVMIFIWLVSFLLVVKKRWQVLLVLSLVILMLALCWVFVFKDYQKERILTFINPALNPQGSGYNVKQSIIAVGAGRLMGRGLGFGSQSQLKFIPESQTDFIFSVIAEELGFVGVAMIFIFFWLIFYRLYRIAARAPDDFAMFFILLAASLIFIHIFINVGMCIGLLPVTGISLPLVSYGGSFLMAVAILMGIILNIYKNSVISRKF